MRAVMLAELGLGESTALSAALTGLYGVTSAEDLLHAFIRRQAPVGHQDKGRAARVVLAQAEAGDTVADAIAESGNEVPQHMVLMAEMPDGFLDT